jgi:hypothetical protein
MSPMPSKAERILLGGCSDVKGEVCYKRKGIKIPDNLELIYRSLGR